MVTMIEGAHVNHVPIMTCGTGLAAIRDFYASHFIPKMPPDTKNQDGSRLAHNQRVADR